MNLWEENESPTMKLRLVWNVDGRDPPFYCGIYLFDGCEVSKKLPPGKFFFIDKKNPLPILDASA